MPKFLLSFAEMLKGVFKSSKGSLTIYQHLFCLFIPPGSWLLALPAINVNVIFMLTVERVAQKERLASSSHLN